MKIEVSNGEIIDKFTILEIKLSKIKDTKKLTNIQHEYDTLTPDVAAIYADAKEESHLKKLQNDLLQVNKKLWKIEDDIRECERANDFGQTFVDLARAVYYINDDRSDVKKEINTYTGSDLVEEKSYEAYKSSQNSGMRNKLYLLLLLSFLVGCKTTYQTQSFSSKNVPTVPDYNQESSWAVLPTTYAETLNTYATTNTEALKADVFYVYPTLITDKKDKRWNVPIDDKKQYDYIINYAVKNQASPFATSGKIYVPIYRQAHIRSYSLYNKGGKQAFEIAYADVKKAFEVYLEKYNKGRPIIIASHSQGTTHTKQLLKDFFDEKPLQKRLIAAYIPGMGINPNEFKTIQPMTTPTETGGFVSWNTRKKGTYPKNKTAFNGAVTTNPITWNTSKTTQLDQHKGFLYSNGKLYSKALKIQIVDGMVWSTNPKFPLRIFMSFMRNYHVGDINLFWQDIRENAELRTRNWFEKNR